MTVNANNQYAPMGGCPSLRTALSTMYGPCASRASRDSTNEKEAEEEEEEEDTPLDPTDEITVCTSGTEAIYAAMQALVDPGDSVVVFEPSFPWYVPAIKMAGGSPVCIKLHAPSFSLTDPRTAGRPGRRVRRLGSIRKVTTARRDYKQPAQPYRSLRHCGRNQSRCSPLHQG